MKKIYILVLLQLVLLISCGGHISHHDHQEEEEHHHHSATGEIVIEPEKSEKLGIKTQKTELKPFYGVLKVSGRIENDYNDSHDIVALCSGKISFIKKNLTVGCEVTQSERLFSISSQEMNNQNLTSELEKCTQNFNLSEKKYQRMLKLRENKLVTESEFLEAENQLKNAQTDLNRLKNAVDRRLLSPCKGYVISVNVENGQYVEEGTLIASVSKGKDILIEADIPSRYSQIIRSIVGANFTYNGKVYSAGKQISSSEFTQNRSTVIPTHFLMEKRPELSAGIPIEVYVQYGESKNAVVVPKSSITEKYGKYYAYVKLDEDCYRECEVTLGESDGQNIEIKSGLTEGLDIVTDGAYYVKAAGTSTAIPHGHSH